MRKDVRRREGDNSVQYNADFFDIFWYEIESYDYNYSYKGGPVEAWPTFPVSVVRSWDVWSPNNSQIEYLDWNSLNPSSGFKLDGTQYLDCCE